ncbi:MAG: Pectinacetylesterase, partial [Pseudomonadota bacterium]
MKTLTFRGIARKALLLSLLAGCAETDAGSGTTAGDAGDQLNGSIPSSSSSSSSTPVSSAPTAGVDAGVTKPTSALPLDGGVKPSGDASVTTPAPDGGTSVAPAADGGTAATGLSALAAPLPTGEAYKGWTWVAVPGSKCRDGSGAGYFWRRGTTNALMVYLNGGGACADPFFCGLNPVNVNQDLPIELLIGGAPNLLFGPNPD